MKDKIETPQRTIEEVRKLMENAKQPSYEYILHFKNGKEISVVETAVRISECMRGKEVMGIGNHFNCMGGKTFDVDFNEVLYAIMYNFVCPVCRISFPNDCEQEIIHREGKAVAEYVCLDCYNKLKQNDTPV